jgi:ribosomal protein S27AE
MHSDPVGQELREEIMVEIATIRASDHGMTCPKCETSLPVAEWVERMDDGKIHYLWWCNCGNKFMTAVDYPIDAAPKVNEINWEEMFPPLLVA